jgi:hypothetical protein
MASGRQRRISIQSGLISPDDYVHAIRPHSTFGAGIGGHDAHCRCRLRLDQVSFTIISPSSTEAEIRKYSELFRSLEERAADPRLDVDEAVGLASDGRLRGKRYLLLSGEPVHPSLYLLRRKLATFPSDNIANLACGRQPRRRFGNGEEARSS